MAIMEIFWLQFLNNCLFIRSVPPKSLDDVVPRHTGTTMERIVKFFDFDLLCDPVYVNISLGLSIAFVSEMNFTIMLPFILKERSFDTDRIAVLLSILAGADIVSRFISPFFGQSIKSKVRIVYLVSLVSGIFCRICKFSKPAKKLPLYASW